MFGFPIKGIQCRDTYASTFAGPRTCCVHAPIRRSRNFANNKYCLTHSDHLAAVSVQVPTALQCLGFIDPAHRLHWRKKHVMDATRNYVWKASAKLKQLKQQLSQSNLVTNPRGLLNLAPKFLPSTEPSPGPWSFAVEFPCRESS